MMAYNEKFAVAVRCKGKILREINEGGYNAVRLPFGSDYSLRLKNLNTKDAVISISIDGKDVLDGDSIVIKANSSTDLDGFMDHDGNVRNAFRFIEKTKKISDYRGDKIDDGLIRIEFQFVKDIVEEHIHHHHHDYHHYDYDWPDWNRPDRWPIVPRWNSTDRIKYGSSGGSSLGERRIESICGDSTPRATSSSPLRSSCMDFDDSNIIEQQDLLNDNGITVKGASTNQNFHTVTVPELEIIKHVIIINLKGEVVKKREPKVLDSMCDRRIKERVTKQVLDRKRVEKPLFVRAKLDCPTCGQSSKSSCKFCSYCGTALV